MMNVKKWSFDMFAGFDIHGATLGILGMGRIGQGIARRGAHGFDMNLFSSVNPAQAAVMSLP